MIGADEILSWSVKALGYNVRCKCCNAVENKKLFNKAGVHKRICNECHDDKLNPKETDEISTSFLYY